MKGRDGGRRAGTSDFVGEGDVSGDCTVSYAEESRVELTVNPEDGREVPSFPRRETRHDDFWPEASPPQTPAIYPLLFFRHGWPRPRIQAFCVGGCHVPLHLLFPSHSRECAPPPFFLAHSVPGITLCKAPTPLLVRRPYPPLPLHSGTVPLSLRTKAPALAPNVRPAPDGQASL